MRRVTAVVVFLFLLTVAGFAQSATSNPIKFDVKNMDTKIDPCVDFFKYACGGWVGNNPIPSDQSRWGRFNQLAEDNLAILHDILDKSSKPDPKRTALEQKIGDYYASCMDEATINNLGAKPIQPDLDRVAKIKNTTDL